MKCQNEEDIVAGRQELEKELFDHYGKRFVIKSIHRGNAPEISMPPSFYLEKAGEGAAPLFVTIYLRGQGRAYSTYQNAFGATAVGTAPAVNVGLIETVVDIDEKYYSYDYWVSSYSAGTFAVGRSIFAAQESPRKNAKNSVRAIFRDACKFDNSINKYASPALYELEVARYMGDFQATEKIRNKLFAGVNTRIEKFVAWCKQDVARTGYLSPIEQTQSLDFKINYINTLIQMGMYKE